MPDILCRIYWAGYFLIIQWNVSEQWIAISITRSSHRAQACNFIKKETRAQVFSCELEKFLNTCEQRFLIFPVNINLVKIKNEDTKVVCVIWLFRSSRPEVFCKKGVLRNVYLCQSLFFNKFGSLTPATLLKKRLWHRCFPVNLKHF